MKPSQLQFDLEAASELQRLGIARSAEAHEPILELARSFARTIARGRPERSVTIDDVQEMLIARGYPHLGNAAGAVFRGEDWEQTGEWRVSSRISNHAHKNRVWRLKG